MLVSDLDWAKVRCKYANRNATCHFLWVGNCSVRSVCYRMRHILRRTVHDLALDLWNGPMENVNMPIEKPFYLLAIVMSVLFVCRLRDNRAWTSECTRIESLTLKLKVRNVDDSDENRPANVTCQREYVEYVCKNWRFCVQPFVRSAQLFISGRTHKRTNARTASIHRSTP